MFGWMFLATIELPCAHADTPAGAKTLATNLRGFGVPFQINANDQSYIDVQLYLSEDKGRTWRFYDRQTTDKTEFPFRADEDGEYWFAIKTLNRNRQLIPDVYLTSALGDGQRDGDRWIVDVAIVEVCLEVRQRGSSAI